MCRDLFAALDRCEETLGKQRYIAGNKLTEADVRLFQTLIRFDEVYVVRGIPAPCARSHLHPCLHGSNQPGSKLLTSCACLAEHMCYCQVQVYFKTNKYFIRERPNLKNYVRDLYHIPGAEVILGLTFLRMAPDFPEPEVPAISKFAYSCLRTLLCQQAL